LPAETEATSTEWASNPDGYGDCLPSPRRCPKTTMLLCTRENPVRYRAFGTRRWLPRGRQARRSRGLLLGGVWLRWRVWKRARDLDDDLAGGVDPTRSDALSLRTGQLRSLKARREIRRSLLAALELAGRQSPPASTLPPLIRRREVLACSELIVALADRIDEDSDLNVQGLAMTSQLLRDGGSPLYCEHARRPLSATLHSALAAVGDAPVVNHASPRTEGSDSR